MIDVSRERVARPLFGLAALVMLLAPRLQAGVFEPATHTRPSGALAQKVTQLGAGEVLDFNPELFPFALFAGDELAQALDAHARDARGEVTAGTVAPGGLVLQLTLESTSRPRGFSLGLESAPEPLLANPPPGEEESYPETRIGALELSEPFRSGGERKLSLIAPWGCGSLSCENAEGVPVNLYGFVAGRPHESTDPLGLAGNYDVANERAKRQARLMAEQREDRPGFWTFFGRGVWNSVTHPATALSEAVESFNGGARRAARSVWKRPETGPRDPEIASNGLDLYDASVDRGYKNLADITEGTAVVALEVAETEAGAKGLGAVAKGTAKLVEVGTAAKREYRAFDVVPYGTKVAGLEKHHGVLDVWAKENVAGYVSRSADSPSILLTSEQHAATKKVYRDWLEARTGKRVGGTVDWKQVSAREAHDLTESMFDAAEVSREARQDYYSQFNQHIYGR